MVLQSSQPSATVFIIIELYERRVSVLEFLKEVQNIDSTLKLAIRVLFIVLSSFEDLKKVKVSDAKEICAMLQSEVLERLPGEIESDEDPLFIFYTLKVADLLYTSCRPMLSMLDVVYDRSPLLERMKLPEDQVNSTAFWWTYFQENISFFSKNSTLMSKMRKDATRRGIESIQLRRMSKLEVDTVALMK